MYERANEPFSRESECRMKTRVKVLLPLLLLLTLPVVVEGQFILTTNNGTITIKGYTGSGGAVDIPSTTNGLPVTSIGNNAFAASFRLSSVTIPDSVTNIGSEAFRSEERRVGKECRS